MLPALDFTAWFLALYIVVITRDFSAALFETFFLTGIVILLTTGTDGGDVEIFNMAVLRPLYGFMGGVAGFALASGLGMRTLVPVHAFSNTRTHVAGPLVLAAIALVTYALVQVAGQAELRGEVTPVSAGAELAICITFIVLLLLSILAVMVFSFCGWESVFMLRYQDDASRHELTPLLPTSQLAVEMTLFTVGIFAPFVAWIVLPHDPTNWPQWGAGLLSIALTTAVFIAMYFALRNRHAMDRVHFDAKHSRVTWLVFILAFGGTYLLTAVTWLIVAEFVTTSFEAMITLFVFTVIIVIFAVVVAVLPTREWIRLA